MLESFGIRPQENGRLEIADLVSELNNLSLVVRLPGDSYSFQKDDPPEFVYVICASPEQAMRVQEWTRNGRSLDKFHGSIALLEATPEYIFVYQAAPLSVLEQISLLLLPILKTQSCRIFSEDGEITSKYATSPEKLFRAE